MGQQTTNLTLRMLEQARCLGTDPGAWCKDFRRDRAGRRCALGLLHAAYGVKDTDFRFVDTTEAVQRLAAEADRLAPFLEKGPPRYGRPAVAANLVAIFNNTHGHRDVMTMFDLAISRLREELAAAAENPTETQRPDAAITENALETAISSRP